MLSEAFEALTAAPNDDDLFPFLQGHAASLGYADVHFAVFDRLDDPTNAQRVIQTTLPRAYRIAYHAARFNRDDPTLRRAAVQQTPFGWYNCPELDQARALRRGRKPVARRMLDLAAAYGFVDGMVVPTHIVGADNIRQVGMVSLYRTVPGCPDLPCWFRFLCQMLHEQAVPCPAATGSANADPVLNDRVRHCLHWAARGKSRSEIAVILGVSHATVDSYVRDALDGLDAVNTTQAVARAIRGGLIFP